MPPFKSDKRRFSPIITRVVRRKMQMLCRTEEQSPYLCTFRLLSSKTAFCPLDIAVITLDEQQHVVVKQKVQR